MKCTLKGHQARTVNFAISFFFVFSAGKFSFSLPEGNTINTVFVDVNHYKL